MKKILFVCLGNICRSPAAEAIFLNKITELDCHSLFKVDSAGTGAWHAGNSADFRMIKAARKRNIEIKSISRQIILDDFQEFDLILTMDHSNYRDVRNLAKQALIKPGLEIKCILDYSSSENLRDVPDPYYGGESGFEDVLDILEEATDGLIDNLNL
tara:strand:+ start:12938 stop:13408 length:471 start_codon:yes stop_codon:yes gene_type:complete